MDWSPIIAGALSGLGAGVIGSVIAPWATWGVEKRRKASEARKELLARIREYARENLGLRESQSTTEYYQVRSHLSKDALTAIRTASGNVVEGRLILVGSPGPQQFDFDPVWAKVLDEISGLERKWHLI